LVLKCAAKKLPLNVPQDKKVENHWNWIACEFGKFGEFVKFGRFGENKLFCLSTDKSIKVGLENVLQVTIACK
jgi:hypothetical protein